MNDSAAGTKAIRSAGHRRSKGSGLSGCSRRTMVGALLSLALGGSFRVLDAQSPQGSTGEMEEIQAVIQQAYVQGIHQRQDEALALEGFHENFRMYVREGGGATPVTVQEWLSRVERMKNDNPGLWEQPTHVEFQQIDINGETAMAKLRTWKGSTFFSTDYMLLYRLPDGWKIVAKVFSTETPD